MPDAQMSCASVTAVSAESWDKMVIRFALNYSLVDADAGPAGDKANGEGGNRPLVHVWPRWDHGIPRGSVRPFSGAIGRSFRREYRSSGIIFSLKPIYHLPVFCNGQTLRRADAAMVSSDNAMER